MARFEIKTLEDISLLSESSELECKQASGKDGKGAIPKDMWESYSAFANTDSGTIILGLKEINRVRVNDRTIRSAPTKKPKHLCSGFLFTLNVSMQYAG